VLGPISISLKLSVCRTVSEIFSIKKWRDLETGGRDRSRSLKMEPIDRSYYFLLVYRVPFLSYFTLNNTVTLKSGLEVFHGHSNWYHSKDWCGFLFAFHSNYGRIFNCL